MDVGVDQHRHHGLAGEAHARRARRLVHIGAAASRDDPCAVDEERGVFDRSAAVADDQAGALERGHAGLGAHGRSEDGKDTKGKCCSTSGDVHAAHRSLHGECGPSYCSASRGGRRGGRPACGVIADLTPERH
jgi:hypothetical protein